MNDILVLGAGGHSKVLIETIQLLNKFNIKGILDGFTQKKNNLNIPVLGGDEKLEYLYKLGIRYAAIGLGDLKIRSSIYNNLISIGYSIPVIKHPTSIISGYSKVGNGTCLFANSVVNAEVFIDENCIINTSCIIEHDCYIGKNVHISPGAILAGGVNIGNNTHIGIGANILPGISVGSNVVVGAGAVVTEDIPDNVVCVGVPAKVIKYT